MLARMQELGWEAHGVDIDPVAVSQALSRGVTARVGDLESQQYPDAYFDAITLGHVIEHLHEPGRLLAECRRVLRPGAQLVARTPNADSWGHRHFGQDWRGLEPPRHIQLFTDRSLRRVAEQAGLEVERVGSIATNAARAILSTSRALRGNRTAGRSVQWDTSVGARLTRAAYQYWERVQLAVDPTAGEELLLMATRPR